MRRPSRSAKVWQAIANRKSPRSIMLSARVAKRQIAQLLADGAEVNAGRRRRDLPSIDLDPDGYLGLAVEECDAIINGFAAKGGAWLA